MNWRRGLFCAWIVISVVWSIWAFKTALDAQDALMISLKEFRWTWFFWEDYIGLIIAPWAAMAAVLATRWAFRGFRSN
jgi:hypothetical protein